MFVRPNDVCLVHGGTHIFELSIVAFVFDDRCLLVLFGHISGISLVRMELLGIMEALEWHPNTDYIINLSGHDYPIKSVHQLFCQSMYFFALITV
jgi:hypothetical protein